MTIFQLKLCKIPVKKEANLMTFFPPKYRWRRKLIQWHNFRQNCPMKTETDLTTFSEIVQNTHEEGNRYNANFSAKTAQKTMKKETVLKPFFPSKLPKISIRKETHWKTFFQPKFPKYPWRKKQLEWHFLVQYCPNFLSTTIQITH